MLAERNCSIFSLSSLRSLSACILTISLGGCFQSLGSPPPEEFLTTNLPPAPTFAKPAAVPDPKVGVKEPAAEITRRERAGRFENARVINCVLLWYETVRNVHAMGAPESDITSTEAECVKKIKEPAAKKKAAPKASTS